MDVSAWARAPTFVFTPISVYSADSRGNFYGRRALDIVFLMLDVEETHPHLRCLRMGRELTFRFHFPCINLHEAP